MSIESTVLLKHCNDYECWGLRSGAKQRAKEQIISLMSRLVGWQTYVMSPPKTNEKIGWKNRPQRSLQMHFLLKSNIYQIRIPIGIQFSFAVLTPANLALNSPIRSKKNRACINYRLRCATSRYSKG